MRLGFNVSIEQHLDVTGEINVAGSKTAAPRPWGAVVEAGNWGTLPWGCIISRYSISI